MVAVVAEQAVVLARVAQVAVVREVLIRRLAQQVRQILVAVAVVAGLTPTMQAEQAAQA